MPERDPTDSLRNIIRRRQRASFVGREAQLAFFRDNLALPADDTSRQFVFTVHGDGGVGKTFLVSRWRELAVEQGYLVAGVTDSVYDVPGVMVELAGQLAAQGAHFRRFEKLHGSYLKRRKE